MKNRLSIILLWLWLCCLVSGQVPDPKLNLDSHGGQGSEMPKIKRPFYPNILMPKGFYLVIVSLPLATFEEAPAALTEMPKVKFNKIYPHTKSGDELYDVSAWFKEGMSSNSQKQWVYYNESTKHLIANADIFLRTYLHRYVVSQIYGYPKQLRIKIEYIEVGDMGVLDIDAIRKSGYTSLFKACWSQSMESMETSYYDGEISLAVEGRFSYHGEKNYGELAMSFRLKSQSFGDLQFSTFIVSGNTLIKELGLSPTGKRRVIVLNVECVNKDGIAIMPPPSLSKFEQLLSSSESGDPFEPEVYSRAYTVPPDFMNLVIAEGETKEKYLLKEKHPFFNKLDQVYDVAPVIRMAEVPLNGKKEAAFFSSNSQLLIVNASAVNHKIIENLVATLAPDFTSNYQIRGQIYEVDARDKPERNVIDLLRHKPKPVINISALSVHGGIGGNLPAQIKSKQGTLEIELQDSADFLLKLNTSANGTLFKGDFLLKSNAGTPQVFELGRAKDSDRVYVLVAEVVRF